MGFPMKNRTILGIICALLAVAVMFGVTPIISKMSSGKITVVQVNKTITQCKAITADDIVMTEIGKYGVSESVIRDKNQVIGKYASSDIQPEINIIPSMLSDSADNADDVFRTLGGTKQAISITVPSFAAAVSGKLKNGDIISIIVTEEKKTTIPAELTYIKVITTTTSKGIDKDKVAPNDDGTYETPSTITLLVNPTQAKLLAYYEANAKMHIDLVYRGDEVTAQVFLDAQDKVFSEKTAGKPGVGADE